MSRLVNRRRLKAFALEVANARAHKFSRLSESFCHICEPNLPQFIKSYIQRLPSKGKTIR